jgi:hypothetical protein
MTEDRVCPKCGGEIWRDAVDVGVGIIYGPYGCNECGWSESEEYDLSMKETALTEDGGAIDQWGGYHPPGSTIALAYRLAENTDRAPFSLVEVADVKEPWND